MGTVMLVDGSALRSFVNDQELFQKAMEPMFKELDLNRDGVLSRAELRPALEKLNLVESHFGAPDKKTPVELKAIYDEVFDRFDTDRNEAVDKEEFVEQFKEILLAIADGMGNNPFYMALEKDSILAVAASRQATA